MYMSAAAFLVYFSFPAWSSGACFATKWISWCTRPVLQQLTAFSRQRQTLFQGRPAFWHWNRLTFAPCRLLSPTGNCRSPTVIGKCYSRSAFANRRCTS